ncbi:MAG: UDP-3-O-(3-hydroxymyristoyl)glucosamine N-acyltransferase [Alphaproteobacteria bacterium]|nr:UDP-3-O-(3-hydroxymyristoyl)glucosamine N-acyltransferase [Alphaproteobacteria bacterium]
MADPRFFKNLGPFTLAQICEKAGIAVPAGAEGSQAIADLADLSGAGAQHLAFFSGAKVLHEAFAASQAGACLVPLAASAKGGKRPEAPAGMVVLESVSVAQAFAVIAAMFYPHHSQPRWQQKDAISPEARIGVDVRLAPGVVIAPGAEIGDRTSLGPGAVIGPGVAIGRDCEIGALVTISHAYVGDRVVMLPGAHVGQPGFGFTTNGSDYLKVPQLGRVIVQDDVEIGSSTTIDRGALGDTVIGEGSKLDNLVMIAHNCQIGRHCVIAGQTGLAGSVVLEDGVVLAGQVGLGDHSRVGAKARMGARSGTGSAIFLDGGVDYGGAPAKPVREWAREIHALARLAKPRKQGSND